MGPSATTATGVRLRVGVGTRHGVGSASQYWRMASTTTGSVSLRLAQECPSLVPSWLVPVVDVPAPRFMHKDISGRPWLMSSALSNGTQLTPSVIKRAFLPSPRVTGRDSRRRAKRYWASCLCPGCRPLIGKWQDICFAEGAEPVPAHCAFCWISGATATQSNGRAAKLPVSRARACTRTPALSLSDAAIGSPIEAMPY
jgi:hypothetical protein